MKWTAEKIAELRRLADAGYMAKDAAASLGVTMLAAVAQAKGQRISFHGRGRRIEVDPEVAFRNRWKAMIGPMKAALRSEIEAMP